MTGVTLGFHTQSPSSFSPSQSAVGGRGQRSGRLGTAAPQNLLLAAAAVPVLSPIYSVELSACGYRQEYSGEERDILIVCDLWHHQMDDQGLSRRPCGVVNWPEPVICQCRVGNQDVTTFVLSDL